MLNTNLVGAMSGMGRQAAGTGDGEAILMPAIKIVKAGTVKVDLNGPAGSDAKTSTYEPNTAKIVGMSNNGAMSSTSYTPVTNPSDSASATAFKVDNNGVCTLPTAGTDGKFADDQFVITYQRRVTSGYAVVNRSDKYPQTVRLLLKVLYVDPCSADCNTHSRFRQ